MRTHKRTSIHQASIDKSNIIGDLKTDYEELFLEILKKVEEFIETKHLAILREL